MTSRLEALEEKAAVAFDALLIIFIAIALSVSFFAQTSRADIFLIAFSLFGLIPVAQSAIKALIGRTLSVDLLAVIALVFSLISHEWSSASFITLMLAFARIFERITEQRSKRIIRSLMKYHVERVRIQVGETFKDIHVSEVKKGDLVVVESGDRMPVDGTVVSGNAAVDESSLTGESELVPKKAGDTVHTATVNESGSLIVRTERVGADTTLARIVKLIEEASRDKNKAEKTADRFTQWYILISLLAAGVMYLLGLHPRTILAILLVVCADDIAVAVPLTFTAGISHAARRGLLVKGSTVFEQLSRMRYILTDKTGTLTRGKPKVYEIKHYGTTSQDEVLRYAGMGASESGHAVSRAILEYSAENRLTVHAPHEFEEISGQGIVFSHDSDTFLMGRPSFVESRGVTIVDAVMDEIKHEKEAGRGVAVITMNGAVVGLVSYQDELRPHVREIIAETKELGIREWHMLTGDNEQAAAAVASSLGISHYHAGMTPEGKVDFIRSFEKAHAGGKKGTVGYMGDGVNDAASLALADVSIAMGGIGSDAAIEAADITIMKDQLSRLPEVMKISQKTMRIMWQNFGIWGITNIIGLALVAFGYIGPAGAATYNFLTDFLPIGNALRAGKK